MKKQHFNARVRLELVACVEFFACVEIDAKERDVVSTKCLRYDYIRHVSGGLTKHNKTDCEGHLPRLRRRLT